MKIFIIRHGDPDYKTDSLTERGQKEAELLCDRLMKENITKVYCSPLGRAQETAAPFLKASGLDCTTYEWLKEVPKQLCQPLKELNISDKDVCNCLWDVDPRFFEAYGKELSDKDNWYHVPAYQAEGVGEYCRMVFSSFDDLLRENFLRKDGLLYHLEKKALDDDYFNNTNIAIFCHMGLGSLLTAYLANIAPPVFWQSFRFMPTSVNTILIKKITAELGAAKIYTFGDTSHLTSIGLTYRG